MQYPEKKKHGIQKWKHIGKCETWQPEIRIIDQGSENSGPEVRNSNRKWETRELKLRNKREQWNGMKKKEHRTRTL
jgi:hypothetical protein